MKVTTNSLAVLSIGLLAGQVSAAACPAPVHYRSTVYMTVTPGAVSTATVLPVAASSPGIFAQSAGDNTSTQTSTSTTFLTSSLSSVPAAAPTTLSTSVLPPVNQVAATTSAAPVSSSSPVAATGGSKRGLAYNVASLANLFTGSSKVNWGYNWGQTSDGLGSAFEFVPLLWGNKDGMTSSWSGNVQKAKAAGSTHLLGWNEPDHPDQANLPVSQAAPLYKQFMTPFAGQFRIGGPAVTNGIQRADGGPMGVPYLEQFMKACADCQIDFTVMHWYGDASNAADFKSQVQKIYAAGGNRPVWITEFQATGGNEQAFLQEVIPWLDSQPFVERYAYFGVFPGNLISGNALSALGKIFSSL